MLKVFKFKSINAAVLFFSALVAIVISLYTFIPQVLASFTSLTKSDVKELLRDHASFTKDHNIEGMLSFYHRDFVMDVVHPSGRKERFNKSQMRKHQEINKLISNFKLNSIHEEITMLDSNQAMVSIIFKQQTSFKKVPLMTSEIFFQSILITKSGNKPKIRNITSIGKSMPPS